MLEKLKLSFIEAIESVFPVTILVMIISTFLGMEKNLVISFIISAILLVIGIALFNFGANLSMVIMGEKLGTGLNKKNNLLYVLIFGFILGFVITIAEPDLMVLASQLSESINSYLLIASVGIGVGLFILIALLRIIKQIKLNKIIIFGYLLVFILLLFANRNFINVAFDSGGVTTGPLSVPFIVAFGYGFTKLRSDKNSKNDTFGLVGLASIGPIIVVLILGMLFKVNNVNAGDSYVILGSLFNAYMKSFINNFKDVIIALSPILLIYSLFEIFNKDLNKFEIRKIVFGLIVTLLGLTIFLTGASVGFMNLAYELGELLTTNKFILVFVGMVIGFLIVKAEPAVKVLTDQVSDLTGGSINKNIINFCLQVGVCIAVGLSMVRVCTGISILYIIVPGYLIALVLSYFTPELFTAVAFDSGGAASGPLTTTFLLPLTIGACNGLNGNLLTDAFGMVALVALSPLIMVQLLGLIYRIKIYKHDRKVTKDLDETIIMVEV